MGTPEDIVAEKYFTPPEDIREQMALEIHKWHCPDEACIDEVYWTGPCMAEYLEGADQILALFSKWAKANHYVKLAANQAFPIPSLGISKDEYKGMEELRDAGWRRVVPE